MKNLKIGITLGLQSNTESIWTNGMKQNVLMFVHLLKKSKQEYEVYILNTFDVDFSTQRPSYLEGIDIYNFKEKFMEMDLIVMMGAQVYDEDIKKFKENKNKRFIGYKCGNNYVIHMENVLFRENKPKYFEYESTFDELWYIPQQHDTNNGFFSTLYRTNAFIVPFIWHNKFLHEAVIGIEQGFKSGKYKKGYKYDPTKEKKVIGIMEPNINIVKYGLIPTMIAEESYRTEIGKNKIDKVMISNGEKLKTNHEFMSILKTFDLHKDKKITAESRYQTAFILTQYFDVVISHQILNPLNYLYLDAAYLGYPVLHNATLCKDLGYYYENGDTKQGAKMLNYILTEHDNNIVEYHKKNDLVLQRYYADNEELIETYDKLIYNLFNGGNKDLIYNPDTNRYDNL
jgi:hypothetical protein